MPPMEKKWLEASQEPPPPPPPPSPSALHSPLNATVVPDRYLSPAATRLPLQHHAKEKKKR
jgi:hypothetical protein